MATVYLARDVRHDRHVALKVLRPELAAVLGAERFLREIKLTANLQHPHILPLLDSGEADGSSSTSCRTSRVSRCATGCSARGSCRSDDALRIAARGRRARSTTRTGTASSTATSSRRTSCCTRASALVADFGIALAVSTGRRRAHDRDRHCRSARRTT